MRPCSSVSKPFPRSSKALPSTYTHEGLDDKLPSTLFLNFAQAIASSLFATVYLVLGSWRDGTLRSKGLSGVLGLDQLRPAQRTQPKQAKSNGQVLAKDEKQKANGVNGHSQPSQTDTSVAWRRTLPVLLFQVSMFQTMAGPIGFSALRHISYPTMVLGKVRSSLGCSCPRGYI